MIHQTKTQKPQVEKKTSHSLNWTQEEDRIIVNAFIAIGSDWKEIQKIIRQRPSTDIKNRINCKLRKLLNRINRKLNRNKRKGIQAHCLQKFMFFTSNQTTIWVTPQQRQHYQYMRLELMPPYLLEPDKMTSEVAQQMFDICVQFNVNFRNIHMKTLSKRDPNKPIASNRLCKMHRQMKEELKVKLQTQQPVLSPFYHQNPLQHQIGFSQSINPIDRQLRVKNEDEAAIKIQENAIHEQMVIFPFLNQEAPQKLITYR